MEFQVYAVHCVRCWTDPRLEIDFKFWQQLKSKVISKYFPKNVGSLTYIIVTLYEGINALITVEMDKNSDFVGNSYKYDDIE